MDVNGTDVINAVIRNHESKTLCPSLLVTGSVNIIYNGVTTALTTGTYKIPDIKLRQGVNIIGVSGTGSVTFTYREADV